MGIGAGLYMYDVVVKKFTFAISSSDEFIVYASCGWELSCPDLRRVHPENVLLKL